MKKRHVTPSKTSPPNLKRPPSSYIIFCQNVRPEVKKKHPNASAKDISALITEWWHELSDNERAEYQKIYEEKKEAYQRELAKLTDEEREQLKQKRRRRRRKKAPTTDTEEKNETGDTSTSRRQRRVKDPKKPKRPQTAYQLFAKDRRTSIKADNPTMKFGEVSTQLGREWRQLTDEQSAPYKKRAHELREQWLQDVKAYEEGQAQEEEA